MTMSLIEALLSQEWQNKLSLLVSTHTLIYAHTCSRVWLCEIYQHMFEEHRLSYRCMITCVYMQIALHLWFENIGHHALLYMHTSKLIIEKYNQNDRKPIVKRNPSEIYIIKRHFEITPIRYSPLRCKACTVCSHSIHSVLFSYVINFGLSILTLIRIELFLSFLAQHALEYVSTLYDAGINTSYSNQQDTFRFIHRTKKFVSFIDNNSLTKSLTATELMIQIQTIQFFCPMI